MGLNNLKETVIHFNELSFAYEKDFVLENVSLKIEKGDYIGIVGPNGGGKTTLLKLILGFLKPSKGFVKVFNQVPFLERHRIAYVPQKLHLSEDFPASVEDVVAMGLFELKMLTPFLSKGNKKRIYQVLDMLGIDNLKGKSFSALSGGQRQRCLIARALVSNPDILLLDEPTASVDSSIEGDIFKLFAEVNEKGITTILVSHDIGFVSKFVNKIVCTNRYVDSHLADEITEKDILKMYGQDFRMIRHQCGL